MNIEFFVFHTSRVSVKKVRIEMQVLTEFNKSFSVQLHLIRDKPLTVFVCCAPAWNFTFMNWSHIDSVPEKELTSKQQKDFGLAVKFSELSRQS